MASEKGWRELREMRADGASPMKLTQTKEGVVVTPGFDAAPGTLVPWANVRDCGEAKP